MLAFHIHHRVLYSGICDGVPEEVDMAFACENEIEIRGGEADDRRKAADLLFVLDIVDESSKSQRESPDALELRFQSVDGLPEEEAMALVEQFPALDVTLVYFSKDGEFFGYARSGPGGSDCAADSADLGEKDLDELGRSFNGDGIAFVRERFGLKK
jgi:hypothetical protein